jgi:hypothetical protein
MIVHRPYPLWGGMAGGAGISGNKFLTEIIMTPGRDVINANFTCSRREGLPAQWFVFSKTRKLGWRYSSTWLVQNAHYLGL